MDVSASDDISFDLAEMTAHAPSTALWVFRIDYIYPSTLNVRRQVMSPFSLYLRKGRLEGFINYKAYNIEAPASVILRKGDVFVITETTHAVELEILFYNDDVAMQLGRQVSHYSGRSLDELPKVFSIPQPYVAETDNLFQWLTQHLSRANSEWYAHGAMFFILQYFFNTACKFYPEPSIVAGEPSGTEIVRRFMELADRYHTEHHFLDFYAAEIGISIKHLSRTVKAYSGKSAVEWIDTLLLVDAKVLLKATSLSVSEISEILKFSSQSFFGKFFKKYTGVSPTDYRKS